MLRRFLNMVVTSSGDKLTRIATHDGVFHCDDVLACYLLKKLDRFKDAEIVRSRDPALLETADAVVDVGGVYDPNTLRFDHHMRTFKETLSSVKGSSYEKYVTKLSSVGLVWAHFGHDVIASMTQLRADDSRVDLLYRKLYEGFIEAIDASDNGIRSCDCEPRFKQNTSLPMRVSFLAPKWDDPGLEDPKTFMRQFEKAMVMAGAEFDEMVDYTTNSWMKARSYVEDCVRQRFEVHKSGKIIKLPKKGLPWKEHLFDLEAEGVVEKEQILFCVYCRGDIWGIVAVPKVLGQFGDRMELPEPWRGLRDEELAGVCGVPDAVFVHASGFCGGAKSCDGVMAMVVKAIEMQDVS